MTHKLFISVYIACFRMSAGRLQLFCAQTELAARTASVRVHPDEMCPDSSFQLYTMHGFRDGEAMALARALLPNETKASYVELFTAIRDAFVTFGVIARFSPILRKQPSRPSALPFRTRE